MIEVEGTEHVVCFVNAGFCALLGKTREELIGQRFINIVPNGSKCAPVLDRVYQTGAFETHIEQADSEHEPAYWLYAMWPALDATEQPVRVVVQMTRSSDFHQNVAAINEALIIGALRQHELRDEAEKSNSQMKAEITGRKAAASALRDAIKQLKSAKEAAERGSRAKDDFLAALSHELRTPLTPVLITAATLREDMRLPDDVREQLRMIERNIALEARLIDDLLDLTKISKGKLEFRAVPCDAHQLIAFAIDIVREDATAKNIQLEMNLSAAKSGLMADPTRFQQVLWNLLRNAIKFTPTGGTVSVSTRLDAAANGEAWFRVEVNDTGIGIHAARLEQIFQPFDQGGLTGDHRFGGVGLGLAIARAVVELHGGRITATSDGLNRGATLLVELPGVVDAELDANGGTMLAFSTSVPSESTLGKPVRKPASLRLLLVEDHAATLQALSRLLQNDGHVIVTAGSVAEALRAADRQTFDYVITDLGLPDGTGAELMKQLRDSHGLQGIALSGYGMAEDLERSHDAGFITHLIKPVAIGDLRRVISGLQRTAT
jgi:signal transduction histidine kinase/CheY-like chemotaxis protein